MSQIYFSLIKCLILVYFLTKFCDNCVYKVFQCNNFSSNESLIIGHESHQNVFIQTDVNAIDSNTTEIDTDRNEDIKEENESQLEDDQTIIKTSDYDEFNHVQQ